VLHTMAAGNARQTRTSVLRRRAGAAAGTKSRLRAYRRSDLSAAAFVGVVVFAELSPAFPHHPAPKLGWWLGGVAATLAAAAVSFVVRTHRRGHWLRYVPLLLFFVAVQMLRAADGDGSAGFSPLLILPVIWCALYGTRLGVGLALGGVAAVQFGPLIFIGAPQYPVTLWRAGVLWVVILGLTGLAAHRLVAAIRGKSAALALSEEQFRTAFSDAPTGVAIIGNTGVQLGLFLQVNRALAALLGRSEDEIVNRSVLEFTHPDDLVATEQRLLDPPERQVGRTIEKCYVHSSGRAVPVQITYSRIETGLGGDPCVVAHVEDITARRSAELEMLSALEQEKETTARLQHLDQSRADLASVVRHEFEEPLASIRGKLDLLLSDATRELTAQQVSLLRDIERNTAELAAITSELVAPSRFEAEAPRTTPDPVDIEAVVRSAIDSIEPMARGHDLALQVDISLAGAQVSGEAAKIDRVLMNLLDNAVKFTPPGGAIAQARVRGGAVVIDVTDTGIGIYPDEQDRIFDQFYRAAGAAQRSIPGTGLGLAVAKAITEQHHGTIEVYSEPGAGSTFTFTLPLRGEPALA
jgi:PAS domain S-box-containing protein